MLLGVLYQGLSDPLDRVGFTQRVYVDALTKTRFMAAFEHVQNALILARSFVQVHLGPGATDGVLRAHMARSVTSWVGSTPTTYKPGVAWDDEGRSEIGELMLPHLAYLGVAVSRAGPAQDPDECRLVATPQANEGVPERLALVDVGDQLGVVWPSQYLAQAAR